MDSTSDDASVHRALRVDVPDLGDVMPPVLDLTVADRRLWTAATNDYDEAALAAVRATVGTRALWRSWRFAAATGSSATRVYVLEADDPEIATAAVRAALTETGPDATLVIGVATDDPAPPAAGAALASSALLWALDATEPVRVAQVFDGVDRDAGPYFHEWHPRLAEDERAAVLGFLDGGRTFVITPQTQQDVLDPQRGRAVPMNYRTDGSWVWTDTVAYYLREHGVAPDGQLLAHVRAAGFVAAEPNLVDLHRALSCLFVPGDVDPASDVVAA